MCGRFTLAVDPADLMELLPGFALPAERELLPRYNIAPTQEIAVVPNTGRNQIEFFRWGLVPSWAKDPKIGNRMINARSETLAEKPSFRVAFRRRRCLILADGFFEWRKETAKAKTPLYVRLKAGKPFAFAGLWEVWSPQDETAPDAAPLLSCTIITTTPNSLLEPIHNRMPVILDPDAYDLWLDTREQSPNELTGLLRPYPAEQMTAYPVSTTVNSPKNDSPACVAPVR